MSIQNKFIQMSVWLDFLKDTLTAKSDFIEKIYSLLVSSCKGNLVPHFGKQKIKAKCLERGMSFGEIPGRRISWNCKLLCGPGGDGKTCMTTPSTPSHMPLISQNCAILFIYLGEILKSGCHRLVMFHFPEGQIVTFYINHYHYISQSNKSNHSTL